MALTPDEIAKILKTPEKTPRLPKSKKPDSSIRDYQTWFKMRHVLIRPDNEETAQCSNPNCSEPKRHMVADVEGILMCRVCFLNGYALKEIAQLTLENGDK